ncbi:MAG: sugar phosphate isomerase/epimerase [Acidobacteria bacterium]|nr:sugar phosphate isomerase/epimerase [Acidobacteriota bacterium]
MAITRRTFSRTLGLGLVGAALPVAAQRPLDVRVGHTGITWPWGNAPGQGPARLSGPEPIVEVVRDVSGLGYRGLELFGWQIEGMEAFGGLGPLLEKHKLPLVSSYSGVNLTDPAQRQTTIANTVRTGKLVKKLGGTVIVIGPNGVPRNTFDFAANKAGIVTALNEVCRAVTDIGLTPVLHQHTGTCIETRDETYAVMEAVDTRYVKFGPDIGQLQKGGADPVKVVKDFLPLVHHMHLKDFSGGEAFLGYCPLGEGKVDLPAILAMMDGKKIDGMVMVELDSSPNQPISAKDTATTAKAYLQKHGVSLRA